MDKLPYLQSCNLRSQLALPISPPCFKVLLQLKQLLLYCIVLCLCNACDCVKQTNIVTHFCLGEASVLLDGLKYSSRPKRRGAGLKVTA